MELFFVTFFIMTLAVLGMAIGVIFGRTPIAGSCGGLNAVNGSGKCGSCSRPCKTRKRSIEKKPDRSLVQSRAQVIRKMDN